MGNIGLFKTSLKESVDGSLGLASDAPSIASSEGKVSDADLNGTTRIDQYNRIVHTLKDSPYELPADFAEGVRLNLQHEIVKFLAQSVYFSEHLKPDLEKGIKVLDVGAGSAVWSTEMANTFPNSEFHAVDIVLGEWSKKAQEVVPNLKFSYGNVMDRLPFEDNTFDFVYQRLLVMAIPMAKWPDVIKEIKRVTKPGGWIEMCEGNLDWRTCAPYALFLKSFGDLMEVKGVNPRIGTELKELMEKGGLDQISGGYISGPVGWGGLVGIAINKDYREIFRALRHALAPLLKVELEEYDRLLDVAYEEALKQEKAYGNYYWAIGRNPS